MRTSRLGVGTALFFALCIFLCTETFAVNQAPTATITAPPTGALYSMPATVTFNASATDPDGTVASVQYFNGTTAISPSVSTSPYAFTWTPSAAGTYSITAKATDNLGKVGAASPAVQVRVVNLTTVISSPANNAALSVDQEVAVSGTFTGPATTTTVIVTGTAGHSVLAGISGNSFSASVPIKRGLLPIEVQVARADGTAEIATVNVNGVTRPVALMLEPANCGPYAPGSSILIKADVFTEFGTITKVEYFSDGVSLGLVTTAPYEKSVVLPPGTHVVSAVATNSFGMTGDASGRSVQVLATNSPPSVTLSSPANGTRYSPPATISFAATASDSDGSVRLVEFLSNGAVVGSSTTSPYQFTLTNVAAGTYDLAARATDNSNATTMSASVRVLVNSAPTVQITSPAQGAALDTPANTTITASATDADGRVVQVQFFVDGVLLGTSNAAPYSVPWSGVGPGVYTLTAIASDDSGASATSAAVTVRVAVHTDPGETIVYLHNDFAGNAIAGTDTAGQPVWRENYRPYGERTRKESDSNRQWFSGKTEDPETGYLYLGARYYDPVVGRFLASDPKAFDEVTLHSFNRYSYANNNPYRFVDLDGRQAFFAGQALQALRPPPSGPTQLATGPIGKPTEAEKLRALEGFSSPGVSFGTPALNTGDLLNFILGGIPLVVYDRGWNLIFNTSESSDGKRFSKDKEALVDMAQADKRKGITKEDMQAYKELNGQLPDPFPESKVRGPESHSSGSPQAQELHGHVGPVDHIPIKTE
jgi:RHS repeat-associated protein